MWKWRLKNALHKERTTQFETSSDINFEDDFMPRQ